MFCRSLYILHVHHTALHKAALQAKMSVTRLLLAIADREMMQRDNDHLDHVYFVLEQLIGAGPKGIKNTSTTIDEVLYGHQPIPMHG